MPYKYVIPEYAQYILQTIEKAGFKAYAVGGCVRDLILGRKPNDWDITTSARCEDIMDIFEHTVPSGEKYGTVTVLYGTENCEVTTFRTDGEYKNSRSPEEVQFVDDVAKDLERRDFTVNAMALSINGEITDIFGGREDIKRRVIKCVGDPDRRFSEDALRMFRALRFSAVLGFEIEDTTQEAIKRNAPGAAALSAERVRDEIEKTLLSPRPQMIAEMARYRLLSEYISRDINEDRLGRLKDIPFDAGLRWCALAMLIFEKSAEEAGGFLKKMRLPGKTVRLAEKAAVLYENLHGERDRLLLTLSKNDPQEVLAAAYAKYVICGTDFSKEVIKELERHDYATVSELAVNGDDLIEQGFSGARIGEALSKLSEAVTLKKVENDRESLIEYLRKI